LRSFVQHPGFTFVVVLTLALGVGANAAVFSVIDAVLLRSYPFPNDQRLVRLWSGTAKEPHDFVSPLNLVAWRERSDTLVDFAAYWRTESTLTGGEDEPARAVTSFTLGNFFSVLGVAPLLGRALAEGDGALEAPPIAMLSYGLWKSRFGGDPGIVGRIIEVDGTSMAIVGVVPPRLEFPPGTELWRNLQIPPSIKARFIDVIALRNPEASVTRVQAEMAAIAAALTEANPELNEGRGVTVAPLREAIVGEARPALLILMGATTLVLFIACANVANLLLVRAESRRREIGLRVALGATRARLARQWLMEALVLSLAGGFVGIVLSMVAIRVLLSWAPTSLPGIVNVAIDHRVLSVGLGIAILTGIAFGISPGLHLRRNDFQSSLKGEGARTLGPGRGTLRNTLVIGQLALALVLTIAAALLSRSFLNLKRVDPGFRTGGIVTFELNLPRGSYPELGQVSHFYETLLIEIRTVPGMQDASMASSLPLGEPHDSFLDVSVVDRPAAENEAPRVHYRKIDPNFFGAIGIPLSRGRPFNDRDHAEAPAVAILNRRAAGLLFPGEDAIGRLLSIRAGNFGVSGAIFNREVRIVGIVENVKFQALSTEARPSLYLPHSQAPFRRMTVVARTGGEPTRFIESLRMIVDRMDPNLPIGRVQTVEEVLSRAVARDRFAALLVSVFGTLGLILAAVGIYGIVSYTVTRRTNEIGLRMALGAGEKEVLGWLLRKSVTTIGVGVGLGITGSLFFGRILSSQLFGVTPNDPATLVIAATVVIGAALLASLVPAVRATRVNPLTALRNE
jgi:putative ABC transport system permease protein